MRVSTIDYKIIGNRIKAKRNELQLTQEDLANEIGISTFYLSKLENGKAHPQLDLLSVIASILDLDLAILVTGTSTLDKKNYVSQLHEICSNASKEQLSLIIKLAKAVIED